MQGTRPHVDFWLSNRTAKPSEEPTGPKAAGGRAESGYGWELHIGAACWSTQPHRLWQIPPRDRFCDTRGAQSSAGTACSLLPWMAMLLPGHPSNYPHILLFSGDVSLTPQPTSQRSFSP